MQRQTDHLPPDNSGGACNSFDTTVACEDLVAGLGEAHTDTEVELQTKVRGDFTTTEKVMVAFTFRTLLRH